MKGISLNDLYSKKKNKNHLFFCVVDGQGGGIGAALIKHMRKYYGECIKITAMGTNAIATSQMLRAGANNGASGENAICQMVKKSHCILGSISITWPNSMLGELTPKIANAIMISPAKKILLPLSQENVEIVGINPEPLPHLIQKLVEQKIKEIVNHV